MLMFCPACFWQKACFHQISCLDTSIAQEAFYSKNATSFLPGTSTACCNNINCTECVVFGIKSVQDTIEAFVFTQFSSQRPKSISVYLETRAASKFWCWSSKPVFHLSAAEISGMRRSLGNKYGFRFWCWNAPFLPMIAPFLPVIAPSLPVQNFHCAVFVELRHVFYIAPFLWTCAWFFCRLGMRLKFWIHESLGILYYMFTVCILGLTLLMLDGPVGQFVSFWDWVFCRNCHGKAIRDAASSHFMSFPIFVYGFWSRMRKPWRRLQKIKEFSPDLVTDAVFVFVRTAFECSRHCRVCRRMWQRCLLSVHAASIIHDVWKGPGA